MINFYYTTNFKLTNENLVSDWIKNCVSNFKFDLGELSYIFCDDEYMHDLNVKFLKHDTFTDIISFDNSIGKEVNGEIYISVERVKENAITYDCSFDEEIHRVMIHGVLHYVGFKDKTEVQKKNMRSAENECLKYLKH